MTTQSAKRKFHQVNDWNCTAAKSTILKPLAEKLSFRWLLSGSILAFICMLNTSGVVAQEAKSAPMVQAPGYAQHNINIFNYTTVYNSGKVFVNWTAKDEQADCIYIVERSSDGRKFESVGVKEGIGTSLELFYSWMDHTPPAGFAYYRVKKITKDGSQLYSSTNTIINQGSSFDQKSNYAKGANEIIDLK